jgi:hypothetical protein
VLPRRAGSGHDPDPLGTLPAEIEDRVLPHGGAADEQVGVTPPDRAGEVVRAEEAEDEAVEICDMRPPVPRVPAKHELLAALPALDEEGSACDRPPRRGIVDPVPPNRPEVRAEQGVSREDPRRVAAPVRERRAELGRHGLRVPRVGAAHLRAPPAKAADVQAEEEVRGREGPAVAPARLGSDAVAKPQRPLREDVHARDEVGTVREPGSQLVVALEHEIDRCEENEPAGRACGVEEVQARPFLGRLHRDDDGPAAFWRLRTGAARAGGGEKRDGDRRR